MKDATDSFLRTIENLAADLAEYSGKKDANQRYIKRQQILIETMKYFYQASMDRIQEVNTECAILHKTFNEYEIMISKLVVICKHHGIEDVLIQLRKTIFELSMEYEHAKKEGYRKLPISFLDFKTVPKIIYEEI